MNARAAVSLAALIASTAGCAGNSPHTMSGSPAPGTGDAGVTAAADAASSSATCAPASAAEAMDCVDPARIEADTTFIAAERVPGSAHWQAVQDLCADRLEALGFDVERASYATGVNVIGTRPAPGTRAGGAIVVSAHYDHIEGCPGAADNATSVAAVLELARVFAAADTHRDLIVACWDEEERGLIGSKAYVASLPEPAGIELAYSFDSFGYVDDAPNSQSLPIGFSLLFPDAADELEAHDMRADFLAIIADEGASASAAAVHGHAQDRGLPANELILDDSLESSELTSDLRRSDHAAFWDADIPAIQITDTANYRNPSYHCLQGTDDVSTVTFEFVVNGTRAVAGAVADAVLD